MEIREILFRGKRETDGEWIFGSLVKKINSAYIICEKIVGCVVDYTEYEVDPETVCQYTGLTDKNGRKIFEGDILKRVLLPTKRIENNFRIAFVPVKSCFSAIDLDGSNVTFISDYINRNFEIEIVGNIFDNPELIGGDVE